MKTIYASIYDPSISIFFKAKANEKAECRTIQCSNSDKCGLFARGECVLRDTLLGSRCPYGYATLIKGPTRRAKGYRKWMEERKEFHKDHFVKLGSPTVKMTIVGDHVYLPYAHMNMNEGVPFLSHGRLFSTGSHFMLWKDFTVEIILKMVDYRPQALMGGEITSYQKETVPKLLTHLKEIFPELYERTITERPGLSGVSRSNIGRQAFIHSLRPGVVVTKYHKENKLETQHWTWDGEYLSSDDARMSFPIVGYERCEIHLVPKPNETVEITHDDQVDDNTRYKD